VALLSLRMLNMMQGRSPTKTVLHASGRLHVPLLRERACGPPSVAASVLLLHNLLDSP
jgi:hypothetical protein